ncbi:MAG: 4-hydroxythreonine-4-phosphate dehydrogenase PdxA [Deltaproteobacteria bacterium]|nr:4-hydroxythreonine-4-phosphate dehydrogenase PdxA [Deltaproteobacteria bacterium]
MKPVIAITMGDPVGVGPEIILKALNDPKVRRISDPLVIGDEGLLHFLAKKLKLKPPVKGAVVSVSELDPKGLRPGHPDKKSGKAMIDYIEEAVYMAALGDADAVVTAPISKEAAKKAGFGFPGHTEFIAHLTNTKDFLMMLGGKDLKVILVTIHEPLRKVPGLVTKEAVLKTLRITDESFKRYFGFRKPRIAVAGLNPHAGEAGIFGDEEAKVIGPAVRKARSLGIEAIGPLPPDTVFYRAVRKKEFDCVVCMYHDQGLGPLKLLHFDDGVNATLGLPIIRTSVDHGTAYDIAWKGKASPGSLIAAIEMAVGMAKKRKRLR